MRIWKYINLHLQHLSQTWYPIPPTSAFGFLQINSHGIHIWSASHNLGVCFNLELLWSAWSVRVLYIKYANSSLEFYAVVRRHSIVNTLRPKQNGRHFPDDIFKCIFFYENVWISIKISLKFVPGGPNNNFPALVLIMAWHRPGVTRLQWVKTEPDEHGTLQTLCTLSGTPFTDME